MLFLGIMSLFFSGRAFESCRYLQSILLALFAMYFLIAAIGSLNN